MPEIKFHRRNCFSGLWGYPNDINGPEWLDPATLMERLISDNEGHKVNLDDLRLFSLTITEEMLAVMVY